QDGLIRQSQGVHPGATQEDQRRDARRAAVLGWRVLADHQRAGIDGDRHAARHEGEPVDVDAAAGLPLLVAPDGPRPGEALGPALPARTAACVGHAGLRTYALAEAEERRLMEQSVRQDDSVVDSEPHTGRVDVAALRASRPGAVAGTGCEERILEA